MQLRYLDFLADQAGVAPVDPELKEMFYNLFKFAAENGFNAASRDLWAENWRPEE